MTEFDSIIIGSVAAPLAAGLAAGAKPWSLSKATVLAGTCGEHRLHADQDLRKSARVAHLARRAADFGVTTGPPR